MRANTENLHIIKNKLPLKNNNKIKTDNIHIYHSNSDKTEDLDRNQRKSVLYAEHNKYFIELNRLLYSKKCINIYIFIIIVSLTIFIYSLIASFTTLPIFISDIVLTLIVIIDMSIRIFIKGCISYFKKMVNMIDLLLISMSIVSIVIYLEHNNLSKKIEEFSFALLLFLRSFSQLLRLFFFLKNQKDVKNNIEEIIHFSSIFEEKKHAIQEPKNKINYLEDLSFVEVEAKKQVKAKGINYTVYDLDYKESADGNDDNEQKKIE